ncbi:hypothetical protein C452_05110 [Haloferax volcanii JCM 10717]|uniref:Uncharacterized protein n=2 Tax=Haloferax volcanii TaxID=2246 RepID=M0I9V8_HALVO|nr:hypothetical protein C452_05110 [Haloferax alexandrinus JCM 10717]
MTRPQIEGDELEMLNELEEAEDVGSHKRMIETLIREAYDERDTNSFVYDPRESRKTPLSTDEMREICWRYDAPAINPDHVMSWPRDRSDKREVLAAICRHEGIDSSGGVKSVIREQLGEGDPITVREVEGEHNKDVRAPRNIHNYHDYILGELEEHPPEEADNLPDDFHGDVEPMFADDEDMMFDTAEEWLEKTQEVVAKGELPVDGVLIPRKEAGERALEDHADHPHIHLIREGVDALEEEIERRRQSDDDDSGDEDDEAEEELAEELEQFEEAEEADDEDENQPDDDRPETEKKREAIKRKGGDPAAKK